MLLANSLTGYYGTGRWKWVVWSFQEAHYEQRTHLQSDCVSRVVCMMCTPFYVILLNVPFRYTMRIAEWVHYVPIQVTYADLYDALAFFRVHDDAAAKIAAAGKKWSQQFWRKEDISAYLYR